MAGDTPAAPINKVLGWKKSDDGAHVIIGFEQPDRTEFAVAISHESLLDTITSFVDALAAFPSPRADQDLFAIGTNWFEIGRVADSTDLAVSFRTQGDGVLAFVMNRTVAERLFDTLAATLWGGANQIPHGTTKQ